MYTTIKTRKKNQLLKFNMLIKSWKLKEETYLAAFIQSKGIHKYSCYKSSIANSLSSNVLSCQIHCNKQWGIIFHLSNPLHLTHCPFQHAKNSISFQGNAQEKPTKLQRKLHKTQATGQCKNKWFTNYPLSLHMQNQSITMIPFLGNLSMVRILPLTVVQKKFTHGCLSPMVVHL